MKVSKSLIKILPLVVAATSLSACNMGPKGGYGNGKYWYDNGAAYPTGYSGQAKTEEEGSWIENPEVEPGMSQAVQDIYENPFIDVGEQTKTNNISLTSTSFAYPVIREQINGNRAYNVKYSVKTEEMLNYFSYGYVNDTEDALTTHLELAECPWNNEHYLASVVVKAKPAVTENIKNNIVILIDKSGSMSGIFDLVKTSLRTLISNLGDDDVVSIVSYASGSQIEIEGKTGKDKKELNKVVDGLKASGSTWGEAGIETAYQVAYKYQIPGGNNRVVILTDGDFNVGKVSGEELTTLIKQKANDGVYLTCVGYRSYDNGTLYTLSNNGNGNAYYIDGELEAKKVFEEELGKSMYVVAKDAKCQIQFSDAVSSYRLLGYETRQMTNEEFDDDKKDAGEIMSDHTTVALYELALKNVYENDYIFKTTLRYKDPVNDENKEVVNTKTNAGVNRTIDFDFAGYVAEFALTLMDSQYKGISSFDHLLGRINNDHINDKYRDDFVSLVRKAKSLLTNG